MQQFQLLINGNLVPAVAGETFQSLNPFTGDPVAEVPRGRAADIDHAVAAARKAFDEGPWPRMSREERSEILHQVAALLQDKATAAQLTQWVVAESGSTARKAKGEVWLSGKQLAYFADLAKRDLTETIEDLSQPGVSKNLIVHEPIGVCAQIIPWNFPLSMAIWKLGAALAAGNTVVLKPAEETPAVALFLAEILHKSPLPPGVVNVVSGTGTEAGAPLAVHPGVDKVAFTGSTEIGKKIMQEAAASMKRVTLECGGKSANIVLNDADLDMAVDGALYAAFFHAGQCCTAGTRLILQSGIYDTFLARFLAKAAQIQLGDPAAKETDMGPLISKKQQERVLGYIEAGKKEGATVALGGGAPTEAGLAQGFFVQPTVFVDVTNQMTIAQEEIFGPVLSVIKVETPEEAVRIANDSIYGLAGAVWSQNEAQAIAVASQLRAGTVWVNEYHLVSEKAPFGGYKQSGLGRELGLEGLKEYTEIKHIHIDELKARDKKFWYDSVLAPKAAEAVK
jgi:aldehyde dehydrogenase (NAD+)